MKNLIVIVLLLTSFACSVVAQNLSEGIAQLQKDNLRSAKQVFQNILAKDPKNTGAWFYLGEIYFMDENIDSANLLFKKALEANSDSYFSQIGIGKILLENNKQAEAEKAFAKARKIAKDKERLEALSLVGRAYLEAHYPNYDKAVSNFLEARDMDTKNARGFVDYGDALLAQGKVGDALSNYELASNKDKDNPEILMKIARAYSKNGIPDVAIENLEAVIAKFPDYAPAYKELYQLYFQKAQYSKVTPLLEKYVSLVGDDVEQRARLVKFLCFQAKDYKKSIAEANIVLEKQPDNYAMYRWLAWSYYELGEYQAAFDASKKFFELVGARPVYASDYEYYAKAASKLNNTALAIENYKKVAAMDSTRTDVYDLIAKTLFDGKQWEAAEAAYSEKISKGKSNSQDWYYLGMSRYQQNKNVEADSAFSKLIAIQPSYATGWLMRARANNRQDPDRKTFQAKPFYEKYIELAAADAEKNKKQLVEAFNYIGYFASQNDDLAGAKSWYEKSVALDANNEEAKNALEQLKSVLGGK